MSTVKARSRTSFSSAAGRLPTPVVWPAISLDFVINKSNFTSTYGDRGEKIGLLEGLGHPLGPGPARRLPPLSVHPIAPLFAIRHRPAQSKPVRRHSLRQLLSGSQSAPSSNSG